ncbi:hypothetical protein [Amycolatopsis sp. lyj-108]|uniref:hypothetical protein n=1 Tax=Amycolatopsis sp. lyj-108 TaxID=2789286 RepID=UPI00397A8AE9
MFTNPPAAVSPPPCTCKVLPQGFHLAVSSGTTIIVMLLGVILFLLGHSVEQILQLVGGLGLVAAGIAWSVTTGRRPVPVPPVWGAA